MAVATSRLFTAQECGNIHLRLTPPVVYVHLETLLFMDCVRNVVVSLLIGLFRLMLSFIRFWTLVSRVNFFAIRLNALVSRFS